MHKRFRKIPIIMRGGMKTRQFAILAAAALVCAPVAAQTIDPFYAGSYTFSDLGSVTDLPTPYGGLTFKAGDANSILIGGAANGPGGLIYQVGVTRDGSGHITG